MSIGEEKGEHWKLMSCTVSIEGARGNKASLCGFKERSQSGVGRAGVQTVLGQLKTKSMKYVISKKTVYYAQGTSYISRRLFSTVPNTVLDVLMTSSSQSANT